MMLKILHLYPKEMNLYGDHGNVLALKRRCQWRGIDIEVISHEPGDDIPDDIDIIFGGGGQDSGQGVIEDDLLRIAPYLKDKIEAGTPALLICGLYQLFGNHFETIEGRIIQGIGILNIATKGAPTRLIGNITINSDDFGQVVGYENHSGLTWLGQGVRPFGTVLAGAGNNGQDKTEGAIYKNCIATYLHGPILPKNPAVADFLIEKALEKKTGEQIKLAPLDDSFELNAHKVAVTRPR